MIRIHIDKNYQPPVFSKVLPSTAGRLNSLRKLRDTSCFGKRALTKNTIKVTQNDIDLILYHVPDDSFITKHDLLINLQGVSRLTTNQIIRVFSNLIADDSFIIEPCLEDGRKRLYQRKEAVV